MRISLADLVPAGLRVALIAREFLSRLCVVVDRCPRWKAAPAARRLWDVQNRGANHMRLIIIGAGFAGMYAALSAARLRDIRGVSPEALEIALVAPEPTLVVRPRLYEENPETLTAPLSDVLKAIDVVYVQGSAETIDSKSRMVQIATAKGTPKTLSYDRLVVATGSRLFRPNIPGLAEHGFSVDQLDDAIALDKHLHALAHRPAVNGRDTVVVAGGGFTGIEAASEMPARLRAILGKEAKPRIIIVDRNNAIAPDMGEGPRPVIEDALRKLGVETRLGAGVASLDKSGVTLSNGEHIQAETVIWAAGIRAAPLTRQIPAERDNFGRLLVDRDLRVPGIAGVFATGDAARAACDDVGNYALMSCQHATRMGAFAGNNAAAELLGVPTKPYHQKAYVTCLDLGEAGALFTRGWDRKVEMVGDTAKKTKQEINTVWIYPPRAERAAALASADPERVTDL
jgi:NADH dehydrogenase